VLGTHYLSASDFGCMRPADSVLLGEMAEGERTAPDFIDLLLGEPARPTGLRMEEAMLTQSDELHVVDTDTGGLMAEMMDDKSLWNLASDALVGDDMGMAPPSSPSVFPRHRSTPDITRGDVPHILASPCLRHAGGMSLYVGTGNPGDVPVVPVISAGNGCGSTASALTEAERYFTHSDFPEGTACKSMYHNWGAGSALVSTKEV